MLKLGFQIYLFSNDSKIDKSLYKSSLNGYFEKLFIYKNREIRLLLWKRLIKNHKVIPENITSLELVQILDFMMKVGVRACLVKICLG